MKKLIALALSLVLSLSLAACGVRDVPIVMEHNGTRLDEDVYEYWLCCYRAQFAYSETPETIERYAELADINIMKTLVAASLFDRYGLQLDEAARDIINAAMDSLVDHAGGTREELNAAAAAYGIDYDGLKLAITYERKAQALYNYLYGQNGILALTKEQYETYYQATYTHVKMIYISYVDFQKDADGNRVWDAQANRYLYTEKTGAALAAQEEKAAAVLAALHGNMSDTELDALIKQYDEDPATATYKNGWYFSSEVDYSDYIPAVVTAAQGLSEGEIAEVRSPYGVHFIYGLSCDEGAYDKEANADFFDGFTDRAARYLYEETIKNHLTEVTIYRDVKQNTRYQDVEPNFDLYW